MKIFHGTRIENVTSILENGFASDIEAGANFFSIDEPPSGIDFREHDTIHVYMLFEFYGEPIVPEQGEVDLVTRKDNILYRMSSRSDSWSIRRTDDDVLQFIDVYHPRMDGKYFIPDYERPARISDIKNEIIERYKGEFIKVNLYSDAKIRRLQEQGVTYNLE